MPASDGGLKDALAGIVGGERVSDDDGDLSGFRSAGPVDGGQPLLVVRPSTTAQVRELIRMARADGLNLVLASSGPPRFRGDTVPDGEAVVVDMSGMDRVLRVDRRNKVALIEPGVTFAGLKAEAAGAGMRPTMPLLPRSSKSVLASFLEREPITIPRYHWDMTDPLLCTELVFGTGDLFRTGSAAGPGGLSEQWARGLAQKNPMGPAQTDFLRIVQGSQGTMAAVTWATIKLELEPTVRRLYFVPSDRLARLVDFSYRALRPKLAEEFFILDSRALATVIARDGSGVESLAAEQAPYTLVYCVSGFEFLPEKRIAYQEEDLGRLAQASGVCAVREVPGASWRTMMEIIDNPGPDPYYKTRPKGAFLDILFLTTLDAAEPLVRLARDVAARHGHPPAELGVYIQPIQHGRACHVELSVYYDPADPAESSKARAVFDDAVPALDAAGAFFSRPYGRWAATAYARCPDTVLALRKVKSMLDPDGVLNRGKLCFSGDGGGEPGEEPGAGEEVA